MFNNSFALAAYTSFYPRLGAYGANLLYPGGKIFLLLHLILLSYFYSKCYSYYVVEDYFYEI